MEGKNVNWWYVGGGLFLLVILIMGVIGYTDRQKSFKTIEGLLSQEAEAFEQKEEARLLFIDIANDIVSDRDKRRVLKRYADINKISYEQAVADSVISTARSLNYIPS